MSKSKGEKQYLIFLKYTREYLHRVTGYSKHTLSRIATGNGGPSEIFIGVCCHTLKESQDDLFKLVEPYAVRSAPAPQGRPAPDLLETINELARRLTQAEKDLKALQDELRQYS